MKNLLPILAVAMLLVACESKTVPETIPTQPVKTEQTTTPAANSKTSDRPRIVFFGNSLTAAYGLNPEQGFTSILQRRLDSLGLNYEIVNAGLSGETTSGGLQRIDWILRDPVEIFVLELGGNDGLRGTDTDLTYRNLRAMIDRVQAQHPETTIVLAGMQAPPNMGGDYTTKFRDIYPKLADSEGVELIPFLLEDVGGIASLNLPDGIHPNAQGQRIVAENVWEVLKPLLQ